ncbi:DUF2127 domain-containing protein [Curtobacterium pusillum]|uniref:DUF2127 domain-containing protein n=1 Tax=Curtobacterium pusillum TaxID=69373 RepID=UPI0011A95BF8|nr:DUF2127 domain-containing protein [Curtobacterium pusillum]
MGRVTRRDGRVVDAVFVLGVLFKAVSGVVELAAGVPLLLFGPHALVVLTDRLVDWLLTVDPDNALAPALSNGVADLGSTGTVLAAAYLLFHGSVKVAIVLALLRGSRRGFLASIGALAVFLVLQLVELVLAPGVGVALLAVVDAALLALTWREYRRGHTLAGAWRAVVRSRVDPSTR